MVDDSSGCPKGLSPDEQLEWSSNLPHRSQRVEWPVNDLLREAMRFEQESQVDDIDEGRNELAKKWIWRASQLQEERAPSAEATWF